MRLLLDAAIQDATVEALRALSPDLEIVDVRGNDGFSYASLVDDRLEVIVGSRAPAELAQVPALRWLQLRSAGVDHLAADPPWRKGITTTNARGVFAVPIAEYVTGMLLDPSYILRQPGAIVAVVLLVVVAKSLVALGIVLAFKYPIRTALTVAAGLAQVGEFSFLLATVGVSLALLPPEGVQLIVAAAIVSITINPFLFRAVDPLSERLARAEPAAAA